MRKKNALRLSGFIGTAGLTVALVGAAVSGTGAYFTDSNSGTVNGTMGTIRVATAGGDGAENLDIAFANLLPGEAQAKTIEFTNSGASAQDVWLVFNQANLGDFNHLTDTGLINDRGTYAEIHVKASGTSVFDSANLNDDSVSCPVGAGTPACNPLPKQIKLADNLAPSAAGTMEFSYAAGAKYKANQGLPEVNLPYKIVATQHGIAPDNALNAAF